MTARHHHYLPQCYLRGFVHHRDKPKLFVVDAERQTTFTTTPRNVAQERDFHTIDTDGLPPDAIEQALSNVEAEIAPALVRIDKAGSLADENDRILALNLAALVAIKNPHQRENMRDFGERIAKQVMRLSVETEERWASQVQQMKQAGYPLDDTADDYQKMRSFVMSDEYRVDTSTEAHLAMEFGAIDAVLPLFIQRKWSVLRAPKDSSGFVTCDRPVRLIWTDPKDKGFYPPGFGLTGTTATFPLSGRIALMGCFEYEAELTIDLDREQLANFNSHIVEGAERQVFARDGDFLFRSARTGRIGRGAELLGDRPRPKSGRTQR